MIQTRYHVLYLVEVKFSLDPIDLGIVDEVQNKMDRLDTGNKRFSIRPILVHVNGVTTKLAKSNFFMRLIDFGELLEIPIPLRM